MPKRVSAAKAKAQLSELMSQVAYGGEHVIIERRGKPLAALVSIAELERLERVPAVAAKADLFEAMIGMWAEVPDEEIDRVIEDIYKDRERDYGRPSPFGE